MPSRWSGNSSLGLTVRCDSTRDHGPHTPPMHPTSEHVHAGGLDVGLAPSCTAVFRSDAPELLPEDRDIARLRDQTVTLSELLLDHTPGWLPTTVPGDVHAVAQVHCHQHAITGWEQGPGTAGRCRRVGRAVAFRMLRVGRQVRIRTRPPGRQPGLRRIGTTSRITPGRPEYGNARRWIQLPNPDSRAVRPRRHPPGRVARGRS